MKMKISQRRKITKIKTILWTWSTYFVILRFSQERIKYGVIPFNDGLPLYKEFEDSFVLRSEISKCSYPGFCHDYAFERKTEQVVPAPHTAAASICKYH